MELEQKKNPSIEVLNKLAKALGVPVAELLFSDDNEFTENVQNGIDKFESQTGHKTLQDYTTDELLKELFRRMGR